MQFARDTRPLAATLLRRKTPFSVHLRPIRPEDAEGLTGPTRSARYYNVDLWQDLGVLAVGFGAQTLVRDIISGFFLILEDQVRVGDVAAINGTGGLVEELNLRTIVLRDIEGTVHVFPNGSITTLANRSKDFSYYVIDLPISYQEDPDRIEADVSGLAIGDSLLGEFGEVIGEAGAHAAGVLQRAVLVDESDAEAVDLQFGNVRHRSFDIVQTPPETLIKRFQLVLVVGIVQTEHRLGMIAKRVGVSQMQVSRLLSRSVARLRDAAFQ